MTIKEFLGEKVKYCDLSTQIYISDKDKGDKMISEIKGYAYICNLFKREDGSIDYEKSIDFQDSLGRWIAEAINDKLKNEINL